MEDAQLTWSFMGMKVGSSLNIPETRWGELQSSLGTLDIPPTALLREAHELTWPGFVNRAAPLLDPHLQPEERLRMRQLSSAWK